MNEPKIPGGCFLVSRKLMNSGIMDKPPEYLKVWIYLLSNASHTDHGNLQRGQGFTSIPKLMDMLTYRVGYREEKPTKKKVWGIIEWLRNPNEGNAKVPMIVTTKVTHGFVYTIVNYGLYQDLDNYEGNNEGTAKERRRERQGNNINKNGNKNDKNDIKYLPDSYEYRASKYLLDKILLRNPDHKEPNIQAWAKHIDYMIRLDNRKPTEIAKVIDWCQADSFWQSNILSTKKLRDKYDQLILKMSNSKDLPKSNQTSIHVADSYKPEGIE